MLQSRCTLSWLLASSSLSLGTPVLSLAGVLLVVPWDPSALSEGWIGSPNTMGPLPSATTLQNALQSTRLGCVYTGLGYIVLNYPGCSSVIFNISHELKDLWAFFAEPLLS